MKVTKGRITLGPCGVVYRAEIKKVWLFGLFHWWTHIGSFPATAEYLPASGFTATEETLKRAYEHAEQSIEEYKNNPNRKGGLVKEVDLAER